MSQFYYDAVISAPYFQAGRSIHDLKKNYPARIHLLIAGATSYRCIVWPGGCTHLVCDEHRLRRKCPGKSSLIFSPFETCGYLAIRWELGIHKINLKYPSVAI